MKTFAALVTAALLAGCVSIDLGKEPAAHAHLSLRDVGAPVSRRADPIVDALLVQPQPGDAVADTLAIAYSRRPNEYAFYQLASWTERPVRQLPRLLQRRLEARGVARAVGLVGDPLRADWLLAVSLDELHHDVSSPPGVARFALTADLFDRRTRTRVAHARFASTAPTPTADSAAAAEALSHAIAQAFDELVPWLESNLQHAATGLPGHKNETATH
jgi:ABC-type uncharacterized transport system auxiliary subunit